MKENTTTATNAFGLSENHVPPCYFWMSGEEIVEGERYRIAVSSSFTDSGEKHLTADSHVSVFDKFTGRYVTFVPHLEVIADPAATLDEHCPDVTEADALTESDIGECI